MMNHMGKTPHHVSVCQCLCPRDAQPGLTRAETKDVFWPCFLPHGAHCEGQSWPGGQQGSTHCWSEARQIFLSCQGVLGQLHRARLGWIRLWADAPTHLCAYGQVHTCAPHACAALSQHFRLQQTTETWPGDHTEFGSLPALEGFEFQYSVWRQTSLKPPYSRSSLGNHLDSRPVLFRLHRLLHYQILVLSTALMPFLAAWIGILNATLISHL